MTIIVGVLALQGAFLEHLVLLHKAAQSISKGQGFSPTDVNLQQFTFIEVRNSQELARCDALVIPGGESTTMSLVASRGGLLEPLRDFVKYEAIQQIHVPCYLVPDLHITNYHFIRGDRKPTWGTCAGLILLAEAANATKKGGQDLIGGLDVRVNRNHFGRQIESFVADLDLPFLRENDGSDDQKFPGVFIRAPVVERILPTVEGIQFGNDIKTDTVVAPSKQAKDEQARSAMSEQVEIMGVLPGRVKRAAELGALIDAGEEAGDVIAVRQGNVFGTSFHPELTSDIRIHVWWLRQVLDALNDR